eukprot:CAMPEP_0174369716 /NCGR_PEP_ID=MMETSP0811_2-20130205/93459_1 /TAXON_ID=73025 ORGANISM="Eutreptiella gymnastica-like, Strain CCMP1594" /NCGR_SAMPLE_ID=MMETSP0811_2 /ASSEMBLY_ACC=CAM_ASM_000667 /LENGTH=230 /DNA_ID=CAMNT_0015514431 /DNA_START=1177 /DNA_END=1870 /DNA_ORIENTATION=+
MADKLRMPYHLGHPQKLVLDSMLQSLQPLGAVPIAEQSQADGDQRQGKRHHLSNSAGLWDAAVQRFSACRTDDAWVRSIQLPAAMDTTRSPPLVSDCHSLLVRDWGSPGRPVLLASLPPPIHPHAPSPDNPKHRCACLLDSEGRPMHVEACPCMLLGQQARGPHLANFPFFFGWISPTVLGKLPESRHVSPFPGCPLDEACSRRATKRGHQSAATTTSGASMSLGRLIMT